MTQAVRDGKTQRYWSENTIKNVASYLTGVVPTMVCWNAVKSPHRKILPFLLESTVAVYLAYDLHSGGLVTTR